MSIDTTTTSFSFRAAKTEIKMTMIGTWILLGLGLGVGIVMLIFGSNTIEGGDIPTGMVRLTIAAVFTALACAMLMSVVALRLHLQHLRAMESIQADAAAHRDQLVRDLRRELQQVRDQARELASILTGAAEKGANEVGRKRDEQRPQN